MTKVLVVTYYYPPAGEMGVLRPLTFTRHLAELGFQPYVLTVKNRSVGAMDPTLVRQIPPGVQVVETFSAEHPILRAPRLLGLDPRWLFLPDVHIGWLPFAVRRGVETIRAECIDVILATAPVFTSLLVGCMLKKRTGRPLVVDFRDSWTQSVFTTYPSGLHQAIESLMERRVVEAADYVVTTTEAMRRALIQKYPVVQAKSETIPNGFAAEDFDGLQPVRFPDKFTIVYAGRLYGPRTAGPFLTAVRSVIDRYPDIGPRLRVIFVGPKNKQTERMIRRLDLTGVVELPGFVPHRDSLQLMTSADVLLLIMAESEGSSNGAAGPLMTPGKTFEYIAARRPILALVPDGAVATLVRDTGSGVVVPPGDPDTIADALYELFGRWRAGTLDVAPFDISVFERRTLAGRLAAVLAAVAHQRDQATS